jgi:hypothetical protein
MGALGEWLFRYRPTTVTHLAEPGCVGRKFQQSAAGTFSLATQLFDEPRRCTVANTSAVPPLKRPVGNLFGLNNFSHHHDPVGQPSVFGLARLGQPALQFSELGEEPQIALGIDPTLGAFFDCPIRIVVAGIGRPSRAIHCTLNQSDFTPKKMN